MKHSKFDRDHSWQWELFASFKLDLVSCYYGSTGFAIYSHETLTAHVPIITARTVTGQLISYH